MAWIHRRGPRDVSRAPDVSVIVAVYNAMPYLTKCLTSLVRQSIGLDRLEIIAVNDGSTDGSGKQLDRFASRYPDTFTVIHQANSGGPAAPSNRGLERATGRYVFFIGADDYLGLQALERMVSAADRFSSDVLLVRMVGVNGRWVPRDIFASTEMDIDLFASALPFALSNTKLFRRELIERLRLRYPEDLRVGSDQPFTLAACLHARRISALADYDYYYSVRRRNQGNITYRSSHEERLRCTEEIMDFTARLLEPGPRRDAISRRHFTIELPKLLRADFLGLDRASQERVCTGIARLVERYLTETIREHLDVSRRLRLALAHGGHLDELLEVIRQDVGPDRPQIIVEGDQVFLGYHCFRSSQLSLPDCVFRITDVPAQSVAAQLDVTAVGWGVGEDGKRALMLTAHSPVELTTSGAKAVRMFAGAIPGRVTVDALGDGAGTVVRTQFSLARLLADCLPLGERRDLRVSVDVNGATGDVRLRMPSGLGWPSRIGRRGYRPYRIAPTNGSDGQLVIDVVPVTVDRVVGRLRRALRRRSY